MPQSWLGKWFMTYKRLWLPDTDAEELLAGEKSILWTSGSSLLSALAAASEDGSVPPGSEVIQVGTDSPADKEAQEWQRQYILRRDPDAEFLGKGGKKVYTWQRATLRLSAALAFGKKFRPLVRFDYLRFIPLRPVLFM